MFKLTSLSLFLILLALLGNSVSGQVVPGPTATRAFAIPFNFDRCAMVYPDNATEWGYLNGLGIVILNNFGLSAEIRATQSAIHNLRNLGVTFHQLPKVSKLFLREATINPLQNQVDPATNAQILSFPGESHPLFVCTDGVWQSQWTAQLQGVGAQIIGGMPPYGALIHLPINNLAALQALPFVYSVVYVDPIERTAPRLGTSVASASFLAEVLIFEGFSAARVQAAMGSPTVTSIFGRTLLTGI